MAVFAPFATVDSRARLLTQLLCDYVSPGHARPHRLAEATPIVARMLCEEEGLSARAARVKAELVTRAYYRERGLEKAPSLCRRLFTQAAARTSAREDVAAHLTEFGFDAQDASAHAARVTQEIYGDAQVGVRPALSLHRPLPWRCIGTRLERYERKLGRPLSRDEVKQLDGLIEGVARSMAGNARAPDAEFEAQLRQAGVTGPALLLVQATREQTPRAAALRPTG